jgi:hypothetical protein
VEGAIGSILAAAVGVAISPVPIIALILMLFSKAAGRNSVSFLLGWLAGLIAVSLVVLALGVEGGSQDGSDSGGVVKIVIGAAFLALALRQWRSRPRDGEETAMPAWMATIDDLSAVKALGLGVVLTALNPKNLGLTIAAAATVGGAGLDGAEEVVTMLVFVLIASLTIIVPVIAYLLARERATPALTELKGWLIANNATVMTILFAVLGAKVLGDGIAIVS